MTGKRKQYSADFKAEATEGTRQGEVDKLHAKIGQLVVQRIFWPRSSVVEPGPEAADDRA
jgi:hypothetical protein